MSFDFSNVRASARKGVRARRGARSWPLFSLSLLPLIAGAAHAGGSPPSVPVRLPSGGVVTAGTATITGSGPNVTISQTSSKAIINWTDFSIGQGGEVGAAIPRPHQVLRCGGQRLQGEGGSEGGGGEACAFSARCPHTCAHNR